MRRTLFTSLLVLLIAGGCASPGRNPLVQDPIALHAQSVVLSPEADARGHESAGSACVAPSGSATPDIIARSVGAAIVRVRSDLKGTPDKHATEGERILPIKTRLGGTGVVIASDGIILTNEHVVRNARSVTIAMADGSTHKVRRIITAPKLDLAVLRIDTPTDTALTPGVRGAKPGDRVVAVSAAHRDEPRAIRSGVVTRRTVSLQKELDATRTRYYDDLIESTAKLEPGFSGGPLLDMDGHLLGINVAALGDPHDKYVRAYAIPMHSTNRELIESLVDQIRRLP